MSGAASTSTAAPAPASGPTPRKRRAVDDSSESANAAAGTNHDGTAQTGAGTTTATESAAMNADVAPPPAKRGRGKARARAGEAPSRSTATRARGGRGRGRGRGRGGRAKARGRARDEDDDDDDEMDFSADEGDSSEDSSTSSDQDESYSPAPTRTASGRRTRPTTKAYDMQRSSGSATPRKESPAPAPAAATASAASIPATLVQWDDEYAQKMKPAGAREIEKSSIISQQQLDQDLAVPALVRLGELVWVRVPLGPPPAGALANAQLSRWPGIVRSRSVAVRNGVSEQLYRVELLGMSALDTLEGVRGENVTPWLGYIPSNTAYLDEKQLDRVIGDVTAAKKRWATIQSEGWLGVAVAFHRAHRIAKAYAAMQIRPIPRLVVGSHLAAKSDGPSDDLASLERRDAHSRYLSYSHVLCGPEVVHVGDFVRLQPNAQIAASARRSVENPDALPTSLVMRIGAIYRGNNWSPLMARGLMLELVPARPDDRTYDRSLYQLPPDVRIALPAPLPGHKWKLVRESGMPNTSGSVKEFETNVLFDSAIAGRLYPITLDAPAHQDPKELPLSLREALTVKKATPGMGEEGMKALSLMLAGMTTGERTACFKTSTYLAGDRTFQLLAAEEQALGDPKK